MTDFEKIAQTDDIPEGEGRSFKLADRVIAIFNRGGQYFAIDDACPHMGASLSTGDLDDQYVVTCPLHAWRFDVRDGTWRDCPRVKIDSFDLRIVGNEIHVRPTPRPRASRQSGE